MKGWFRLDADSRYVENSDEYRKDSMDFVNQESLTLHRYDLSHDLFVDEGAEAIHGALAIVLDTRNHPILLHDDMGKEKVTLICSLIRRIQGWSLTGIFAEGDMFAGPAGGSEGGGVGEAGREVSLPICCGDPATRPDTGGGVGSMLTTVHNSVRSEICRRGSSL